MSSVSAGKPRYFCQECGAGYTEEEMEDGVAVTRHGEVYCFKCFRNKFPEECANHPGKKATAACALCGMRFCSDCLVELQDERFCRQCKVSAIHELRYGSTARAKGTVLSPRTVLLLGIFSFFNPGSGIAAVIAYCIHRKQVARGLLFASSAANMGLVLSILSLIAYGIVFLVQVSSGNFF